MNDVNLYIEYVLLFFFVVVVVTTSLLASRGIVALWSEHFYGPGCHRIMCRLISPSSARRGWSVWPLPQSSPRDREVGGHNLETIYWNRRTLKCVDPLAPFSHDMHFVDWHLMKGTVTLEAPCALNHLKHERVQHAGVNMIIGSTWCTRPPPPTVLAGWGNHELKTIGLPETGPA